MGVSGLNVNDDANTEKRAALGFFGGHNYNFRAAILAEALRFRIATSLSRLYQ